MSSNPKNNAREVLRSIPAVDEILSEFRSGDGYARPSRYEILIQPPNGFAGEGRTELKNIWGLIMNQNSRDGTVRRTSLRCSQISFPGRNYSTIISDNGFVLITFLANLTASNKILISSLWLKKFGFTRGESNGFEECNLTSPLAFGFIMQGVRVNP